MVHMLDVLAWGFSREAFSNKDCIEAETMNQTLLSDHHIYKVKASDLLSLLSLKRRHYSGNSWCRRRIEKAD